MMATKHTLKQLHRVLLITGLLVVLVSLPSKAADKSGVGPNTISLPKGPGSIEGLGESFQPTLNTGTAKYAIALKVPPGTAGHAPELRLIYEGGGGNGPLGYGWELPKACVQRRSDHGIPTYGRNIGFDRVDTFINEMKEELVPQTNGFYFCKNEGAFIRYRQVTDHWEGTLPNGTKMEFGLTSSARLQDSSGNLVYAWLLEKETDTHGNCIVYAYNCFAGDANLNQKYLAQISYGPGAPPWKNFHFVTLVYEDRPDWFEDCRSGFIVRTGRRLRSIVVGTQGPSLAGHLSGDFNQDGIPDNLVRRYDLDYLNYAGTNSHWSLLAKVTPVGADGTTSLPAETFGYAVSNPPNSLSATSGFIGGINEPTSVMDSTLVELVDLNGDGLPDLLKTDAFGGSHTAYLNRGEVVANGVRLIQWANGTVVSSADGLAWNVNLQSTSPIAHLADMNGDGLADLVYTSAIGDVYFFLNQGTLAWGPRRPMSVRDFSPPSPFGNPYVRTADLDFDKRMDIIQSVDGSQYQIWFNLGDQNYSPRVTVSQTNGLSFADQTVQIADFNGDRVPDIVWVRPSGLVITPGLGYGLFADTVTVRLPDLTLNDTQVAKAKLVDINGDGLVDLVIERAAPGELWYWLNLGNYSLSPRKVVTGLPTQIGQNAVIRWADLNGNGTTDLIYADHSSNPRLQTIELGELINGGAVPNRLVAITNGIGRITLIGYDPSTRSALDDAASGQVWPDPMPFPVQVVSSVTNLDSLGHSYVTQFRYHNGYYDPVEKQFRGFARVEQIDVGDATAPTLVTRSFFDTGRNYEVMKGKLLVLTAEQQDGALFSAETNYWTVPPVILYTGTNGTNVSYVHPVAKAKLISEAGQGTPRLLESEFAYDSYGNETTNADYGIVVNGDRSAFHDERIVANSYALNLDAWIIHHPRRHEVMDLTGNVISRTDFFYDDETFSGNNAGLVTIGNLTLKREWIDQSNAMAFIRAARTKYDAYGNPITLIDPLGSADGGPVDVTQGHVRQIGYDNWFHAYPTSETIYVGVGRDPLVFKADYDPAFGTVTASYDFNGNQTTYGYDVFARLTSILKPLDTAAYPTVEYDYALAVATPDGGLVNFIETRQLDKVSGTSASNKRDYYFISRQFVDGLGRKLMTKTEAEPETPGGSPRVVVSGAALFNARTKPTVTLNPFFSVQIASTLDQLLNFENIEAPSWKGTFYANGQIQVLDLPSAHQSLVSYDATLRSIRETNPDGTFRRTVYEPLLKRSFDEEQNTLSSPHFGASMVHYDDGLGRLVQVDEVVHLNDDGTPSTDLRTWTTQYEYDVNDLLTHITDSQGNQKWFRYDGLKRKLFMNDPDRGTMTYTYDDASNLRETVDAKQQHIQYTYDGVNRLLTEDYLDAFNRSPDVAYHYDTPAGLIDLGDGTQGTPQNTKGMLAWVQDLAGEEHISYDARGRVSFVVKRIPDPQFLSLAPTGGEGRGEGGVLVSYKTAYQHDSLDRVTTLVYPDNDQVSYGYNPRNLLQNIVGGPSGFVISNIAYQVSAQLGQIDYGNGVRTIYSYDPRLRLNRLNTLSPQRGEGQGEGLPLIDFAYDFDNVSNIKAITDNRPTSVVAFGDPRRNTQVFAYDDLYRITQAQYSFNAPGAAVRNDGQINYRYDRIGNMLAQTSSLSDTDPLTGLPVANLGQMVSGGSAGTGNRIGRSANDPPGPHALTSITAASTNSPNRAYLYDSNGNMTVIDGLTNTWDFKDRLVAVENAQMRAQYSYDYTDRRITKRVWHKSSLAPTGGEGQGEGASPSLTTLYIDKYFEVREHDAPVKYIWNGNTRVARVTSSLNSTQRVQRVRLWPGYNLISVAVDGATVPASPELSAYLWNQGALGWQTVSSGTRLPARSVLWVHAATNSLLTFTGIYSDPTNSPVASGPNFLPVPGLEALSLSTSNPQFSTNQWRYDAQNQLWQIATTAPPTNFTSLPPTLASGEVLFVRSDATSQLTPTDPSLELRYYSQDHLGSSTVLSDTVGHVVEEDGFYPFAQPRNRFQPRTVDESYTFTQKEKDRESGLQYFEARFLEASVGRFASVDPVLGETSASLIGSPESLNLYSYASGNPINRIDPTGLDWRSTTADFATGVADFATGVADRLSYGIGPMLRREYGIGLGGVNQSSTAYKVGEVAGTVASVYRPAEAAVGAAAGVARQQPNIAASEIRILRTLSQKSGVEFGLAGRLAETRLGIGKRWIASKFPQLEKVLGIPEWRGGKSIISTGKDVDIWMQSGISADKQSGIVNAMERLFGKPGDTAYMKYYPKVQNLTEAGVLRFKNGEVYKHFAPWQ